MKIITATGRMRGRRRRALGLLLACSALATPALAQTKSVFPPQNSSPLSSTTGTTALRGSTTAATGSTATTDQNAADPNVATGTVPNRTTTAGVEPPYEDDLNQSREQPLDPGIDPVESQEAPSVPGDPTGIRLGTFMLRPSINQGINTENTNTNGVQTRRNYLSTTIRGTLTSDWSRHALTVTGAGTFERNITASPTGEKPSAQIDADLRLDLANDTVAHVKTGYGFTRESSYDPNAIGGAATQSGVNQFTGGASVTRDFGKIRGTAAVDLSRSIYTDAKLSNGTILSMKDRDRSGIDGRLRLGYELSTALVPYVEVATGRTAYDQRFDNSGYARSSRDYAARTGVEFDFGEKLRGEVGTGYEVVNYEDSRLKSVGAITFNGNATWSPQRGTNIDLGLRTTVQDSTTAGQSGWVEYQTTAALAHEMRDNLVARLTSTTTLRQFSGGGLTDETVWVGGAGLTWAINRYLDLTGDVSYERAQGGGANDKIVRAGVGLTLKR